MVVAVMVIVCGRHCWTPVWVSINQSVFLTWLIWHIVITKSTAAQCRDVKWRSSVSVFAAGVTVVKGWDVNCLRQWWRWTKGEPYMYFHLYELCFCCNCCSVYTRGRQSPAHGLNPARKLRQSGPRRLVSFNIKSCPCAPTKRTERWAIIFTLSGV